jgi:hypothetical protein
MIKLIIIMAKFTILKLIIVQLLMKKPIKMKINHN